MARATVPPQAFNSAVDLPRARLGRRQRSIGPGRAVDQGGSARDVGLGGGSIEDLGLAQGDRWGWPRHRWGWPVRVVDQGGGSGGPGHGTPQAFNSAVDLPRARLGRRQRSIGPGRAVDQGGSARDVGLGGGSVEDLGLVQGDRWGWPRHRWGWPARVVDQGGSARGVRLGGGSGGPGPRYPPRRSTLRWTCPGRALGEGSGRSGLGAPWTRAAQLATSAWAVAPSRTWA